MRLKREIRSLQENLLLPADLDIHFNGTLNTYSGAGLGGSGFLKAQSNHSLSREMVAIESIKNVLPMLHLLSILISPPDYCQHGTSLTGAICAKKETTL